MAMLEAYQAVRARLMDDMRSAWDWDATVPIFTAPMETLEVPSTAQQFGVVNLSGSLNADYDTAGQGELHTWVFEVVGSWRRTPELVRSDFGPDMCFRLRAAIHPASESPQSGYADVASLWMVKTMDFDLGEPMDGWVRVMATVEFVVLAGRLEA